MKLEFTSLGGSLTQPNGEPISWSAYIRVVLGVTADLSIIGWAMVYVGKLPHMPDWLVFSMALGVMLLSGCVYWLTAKELYQLLDTFRSKIARLSCLLTAFIFVQLISVIPAIYGLANAKP
ncbi:hypothetical protein [Chromobacterium piscinae]|uniref:hypothetical protein n=1 Tax=Chromobacterium piscinae TaxID=686831 RepID=UPI003F7F7D42